MKKQTQVAALAVLVFTLTLGGEMAAQAQGRTNRTGNANFRNVDWQNMDPAELQKMIQQQLMESYRERLEVTDDAEWKLVEVRLSKVTQARMEAMADGSGMMGFGGMGGRNGGFGGGGRGLQGLLGQPSAEAQALQQAVDAKAPAAEIKARLAKLQEFRKQKQADLAKAQSELRQVLTPRQEAIAVLMGLLE